MKVIRIHEFGGSDQIRIEEVPPPKVKAEEVLVKIHDAGVNPVDWKIREGYLKNYIPTQFPYTLGQDFSGEIVEVGPKVYEYHVGDEVFGFAHGSYAEYAVANTSKIAHKPKTIDFITAASIPTAGLTAWQIVNSVAQVSNNQKILIHGAAGGVGSFAVQIAKSKGANIVATASKRDAEYLKSLGVERVIDYKTEEFEDIVKDMDLVIDLVGEETLNRSYPIIRRGGMIVTTVGTVDESQAERLGIRAVEFVMEQNGRELAELVRLIDEGIVKPRIGEVLPLNDAKQAQDLNQGRKSSGKIILKVA